MTDELPKTLMGLPVVESDDLPKLKDGDIIFGAPIVPPIARAEVIKEFLSKEPFTIATRLLFDKHGNLYCKPLEGMTNRTEVLFVMAYNYARVFTENGQLVAILPNEKAKAEFAEIVTYFKPRPASKSYLEFCNYQRVSMVIDWEGMAIEL